MSSKVICALAKRMKVFDLQDRAIKAASLVSKAAVAHSFVLKSSTCLVVYSRVSPLDANRMSTLPRVGKGIPFPTYSEAKNLSCHCYRPGRPGHQNRHGYSDRTGHQNRHGFFSSFPDSNRVSNIRNAFQGSMELQSLTRRVISLLTRHLFWARDSSSHNNLSFRS